MNVTLIFYNDKSCRPVNMDVEEQQFTEGGSRALFRDPDNDALSAISIVDMDGYTYIWTVDGWTFLGRLTQSPVNTEAWTINQNYLEDEA